MPDPCIAGVDKNSYNLYHLNMNQPFSPFGLSNIPPRTQAAKHLFINSSNHEGNLALTLRGGWSEYKPDQVREIITSMQNWLDEIVNWKCEYCGAEDNVTIPYPTKSWGEYPWVRCRHCKKKTKRADLGLT